MEDAGFLMIDKPTGCTSHDIIYKLRKITSIRKIGHAGTLDPFASGLLICAVARTATREIDRFVKLDKEYIADLFLGARSDTYDREGKILENRENYNFSKKNCNVETRCIASIQEVLDKFQGKQEQVPPMFSAKKVGGKKLYQLARKGIEIKREPFQIEIFEIELLDYAWPRLKIRVSCSSGTYIRSLASDIGDTLGCGAYLEELRRTRIGKFRIEEAVSIDKLDSNNWREYLRYELLTLHTSLLKT